MKLKLNSKKFEMDLLAVNDESVTVQVRDTQAKRANFKLGNTNLKGASTPVERNKINTKRSKKQTKLKDVARWLENSDRNGGMFSDAWDEVNNKELIQIMELFMVRDKSATDIKRLTNASRSIVRNRILRRDMGRNTTKRAKQKGFDRFGLSTGTLFNNIIGVYREK